MGTESATKRAGGMSITVRENHYYHSLFNSLTAFRNPAPTFHNMSIGLYPFSLLLIHLFFCPGFLFFVPPFCPFTSRPSLTASCLFCQQLKWHCEQSLLTLVERLHHTKHLKSLNWSAYTKSRMQLPNKNSINRNAEAVKTSNLVFLFNWH